MGATNSTPTPTSDAAARAAIAKTDPALAAMLENKSTLSSSIRDYYTSAYAKPNETVRAAIRAEAVARDDFDLYEQFSTLQVDPTVTNESATIEFRGKQLARQFANHATLVLVSASPADYESSTIKSYLSAAQLENVAQLRIAATSTAVEAATIVKAIADDTIAVAAEVTNAVNEVAADTSAVAEQVAADAATVTADAKTVSEFCAAVIAEQQ